MENRWFCLSGQHYGFFSEIIVLTLSDILEISFIFVPYADVESKINSVTWREQISESLQPWVVKKRQKDISDIDQKIISMYAKGMTTRQIPETIGDNHGFETSKGFISDVTDKILPQIEDWQNQLLYEVYPILYIDAVCYSIRDNGVIRKLATYVIPGINAEGKKCLQSVLEKIKVQSTGSLF